MRINFKFKQESISLIISILAIIVSIMSFAYTIHKDNLDNQELISITDSSFSYDEMLSYDMSGGFRGQGVIDGLNYTIILANNSKQKISLVSYDIFQRGQSLRFQYSNMIKGIKDQKNQEITFPLSLDAGEAISLTFEVNTLIPSDINMLLLEKYGTSTEISSQELITYLGENSRDLFGNDVNYTPYGDGTYSIEIDAPSFPSYDLQLSTSKGTTVQTVLTQ